jgi:hypothetical protein
MGVPSGSGQRPPTADRSIRPRAALAAPETGNPLRPGARATPGAAVGPPRPPRPVTGSLHPARAPRPDREGAHEKSTPAPREHGAAGGLAGHAPPQAKRAPPLRAVQGSPRRGGSPLHRCPASSRCNRHLGSRPAPRAVRARHRPEGTLLPAPQPWSCPRPLGRQWVPDRPRKANARSRLSGHSSCGLTAGRSLESNWPLLSGAPWRRRRRRNTRPTVSEARDNGAPLSHASLRNREDGTRPRRIAIGPGELHTARCRSTLC